MEKEKCNCTEECNCDENCECTEECNRSENCECAEDCKCDEECECNEECKCNEDCNCNEDCECDEECNCNEDCECTEECNCNEDCNCTEECNCEECDCQEPLENNPPKKKKKDKPKEQIKKLEEEVKALEQKVLMKDADLINYRRRKDEEVSRMLKYSNEEIVKEILPALDNFERAINMDDDNLEDEVSKFLAGFKMIYCHLKEALEKYEVIAIDGANKPFDPTYHQAVLTEKREDLEPGTVIEVMQKGYLLKDKVIRPAMVRVSE